MPRPSDNVARLAELYRLGVSRERTTGPAGARLGRGTGSSLEFQDRRSYAAGDDIRHLDWRTFARTNQLQVKLYREEISPRVEILLDTSRSMRTEEAKAQRAVDLAGLMAQLARSDGFQVALIALADAVEPLSRERFEREGVEFESRTALQSALVSSRSLLRNGALRILISDFLSPHDARELVRPLCANAGGLALLQVLSGEDAEPTAGRALRLTDAETDQALDLVLDEQSLRLYRERLENLVSELSAEARRGKGVLATITTRESLEQTCRETLLPAGVLES
jgi:uncharacterized protein (DUF58 family)